MRKKTQKEPQCMRMENSVAMKLAFSVSKANINEFREDGIDL